MVRNRGKKGGNWLQMLFWCCQDLKTAELLCPPIGDMKSQDAILCLNSVQENVNWKSKNPHMKGNIWTWGASTATGTDSSRKAAEARSQRIRAVRLQRQVPFTWAWLFPSTAPSCSPLTRGDGEGTGGVSKNLLHPAFDGSHIVLVCAWWMELSIFPLNTEFQKASDNLDLMRLCQNTFVKPGWSMLVRIQESNNP